MTTGDLYALLDGISKSGGTEFEGNLIEMSRVVGFVVTLPTVP
jgi:hypothetical protein